jgi:hypothetical protein
VTSETVASPQFARQVRPGGWPVDRQALLVVARRYAMVAAAALALAALHLRHRPATVCIFREVTGQPCPFCGGTTAAVRLGHGQVGGALAASPLAVAMLATWPFLNVVHAPAWWQQKWARWSVIAAVLIGSEIWELVRFGIISFH